MIHQRELNRPDRGRTQRFWRTEEMLVHSYGARKPTKGLELLRDQLWLAHKYRNALVELELWRRAALDYETKEDVKAAYAADQRALRAKSGLGWGTYQLIEQDVMRASKTRSPQFRRFDGTGRVGAAVQACSKLQSAHIVAGDKKSAVRFVGSGKYVVCCMRITDEWVELPLKVHRPVPDGQVVRATITVDRVGSEWIFKVQFTLRVDAPDLVTGSGRVAINFGWRRVEEGIRVAYAVGEHGEQELVIPKRIVAKFRHVEQLRGTADELAAAFLGDARRRTRERERALRAHPIDARRAALVHVREVTKESRYEHWARRDRHLHQWESDERRSAIAARAEIYKVWARQIARLYGECIVEEFDIKKVAERNDDPSYLQQAAHYRTLVAPSSLRAEIKRVFGTRLITVKPKDLTKKCHHCGRLCVFDRVRKLVHVCEHCGARWDQDANNARNQHAEAAAE